MNPLRDHESHGPSLAARVRASLGALDRLLGLLVARSTCEPSAIASPGRTAWLRPLAIHVVELEYTLRHHSDPMPHAISTVCADILALLQGTGAQCDFFLRYALERRACLELVSAHEEAWAACRALRASVDKERQNSVNPSRRS